MKNDKVRKSIGEAFIKAISENPLTWNKGFSTLNPPINGIYGTKYGNYNRLLLSMIMIKRSYEDPRWYSQSYIFGSYENREKKWNDPTKIKVVKDESPVYIDTAFFVPTLEGKKNGFKTISPKEFYSLKKADQAQYKPYPARKAIAVYNGQQLTGIPEWKVTKLQVEKKSICMPIELAVQNMGVCIQEHKNVTTPCYKLLEDKVYLPTFECFNNEYDYYATKLHELAHASGHSSRLNRNMEGKFGSAQYAIEELRAEIASCFMASEFKLDLNEQNMDNHKAYVQSWCEAIDKDESVLITAIFEAEKISNYIEDKAELKLFLEKQIESRETFNTGYSPEPINHTVNKRKAR